jgi:peptide/nickel transport system substrate-binding protein/oligopeptide transport system substrate-binding protein
MSDRRLPAITLVAGLLALGASGCGRPFSGEAHANPRPEHSGGTLRLCQHAPGTLDPARLTSVYEAAIVNQVFDGLVAWDLDLNPIPSLAREWTISADGLRYRFELQSEVRFHDGTLLQAEDAVYSIERLLRLNRGQVSTTLEVLRSIEGARAYAAGDAESVTGLNVQGPLTLLIRLTRPEPALLRALATDSLKILPRHLTALQGERFGREPVGTGPFRLLSWDQRKLVLEAFPAHFRGRPYLDRLIFLTDPRLSGDRLTDAFLQGKLDVIQADREVLARLKRRGEFPTMQRIEPNLFYLGFNVKRPPFDRQELRRAISYAIDRHALAESIGPTAVPAHGIVPTGVPGHLPSRQSDLHSAPAAAQWLGRLESELRGNPPSVEIWAYGNQDADRQVVDTLRRQGIDAKLKDVSWEELDRATSDGTAGAFLLGLVVDLPEASSFLFDCFHSQGSGNWYGYANPVVDQLLEAARDERDPLRTALMLKRAETLILEDAPVVPLFHQINQVALQPGVKGFAMNPFGLGDVAYEHVWLE